MTLVLHDHPLSSNAQKARLMLDIVGAEYTLREVPFATERPDWHLAVNPLGGIPALSDGGFQLAESNTILRYLADREGRDDLYPRDPQARAAIDWVLDLWALVVRPACFTYEAASYGIVLGRGMYAKEAAPAADVQALFDKAVPKLDRQGRMTIADIAATPVLHRLLHAPVDTAQTPRLRAWAEACVEIPEWQALVPICGVPSR